MHFITEFGPLCPFSGAGRILAKCAGHVQAENDCVAATLLAQWGTSLRVGVNVPWVQWLKLEAGCTDKSSIGH